LFGAIEPLQSFVQDRRHFGPPSGLLLSAFLVLGIWVPQTRHPERRLLTILHEQSHRMKRQKGVLLAEGQTPGRADKIPISCG
jgi:hypothetical protein